MIQHKVEGGGEAVLLERCRMCEQAALEQLITKYQNPIYNLILKICANRDDAAELTQETFIKVIENINKFRGQSRFYSWAFRIAVNLTLSYRKRNARRRFISIDDDTQKNERGKRILKDFLEDRSCSDPVLSAHNNDLYRIVLLAMTRLGAEQRVVIILHDIEAFNYTQIAEILNIKPGTVKSRLSRGRGRLREILIPERKL